MISLVPDLTGKPEETGEPEETTDEATTLTYDLPTEMDSSDSEELALFGETTMSPFGRIVQLDFSPVLKFQNPIEKFLGNMFNKDKKVSPTKNPGHTPNVQLKKAFPTRKIPKRFMKQSRGKSPGFSPVKLKMGNQGMGSRYQTTTDHTSLSRNSGSTLTTGLNSGSESPEVPFILGPSKVLFSEQNSTNKFAVKLWDTVPFVEGRKIPNGYYSMFS